MSIIATSDLRPIYDKFKTQMALLRATTESAMADTLAASMPIDWVLGVYRKVIMDRARLAKFAAIPGIADFAATVEGDPAYDLIAEIAVLDSAMAGVTTWIDGAIPKDAAGWWGWCQTDGSAITIRTFNSAQLAGFRVAAQSVVDAITA